MNLMLFLLSSNFLTFNFSRTQKTFDRFISYFCDRNQPNQLINVEFRQSV